MRPILCNMHGRKFRGHGISRVMRKVVFNFCAKCWSDRRACEVLMDNATKPAVREKAA